MNNHAQKSTPPSSTISSMPTTSSISRASSTASAMSACGIRRTRTFPDRAQHGARARHRRRYRRARSRWQRDRSRTRPARISNASSTARSTARGPMWSPSCTAIRRASFRSASSPRAAEARSHMGGYLGDGVPVYEIRDAGGPATDMLVKTPELGRALAKSLGQIQHRADARSRRDHGRHCLGPSGRLSRRLCREERAASDGSAPPR